MLDSFGRDINYLRISVTDRCNLRCTYCMPAEGVAWLPHERILSFEDMARVARAAANLGFIKFRITGGEPLARKGVAQFVSMLVRIPGVHTVAMTTNGTLLAPVAADLAARGLRSVNVSLDTMNPERYTRLTRGGRLEDAVAGVRSACAAGLTVKLNAVRSVEDDPAELAAVEAFAREEGCAVQTIRRYRLDENKIDDDRFMRPAPCAGCDRIRLLPTGVLKPCLHGDAAVAVDFDDIERSIRSCVEMKPPCGTAASEHVVSAIGG